MSANTSQAFCQGILGCLSPPSKAQLRSGGQNSAAKPTHDAGGSSRRSNSQPGSSALGKLCAEQPDLPCSHSVAWHGTWQYGQFIGQSASGLRQFCWGAARLAAALIAVSLAAANMQAASKPQHPFPSLCCTAPVGHHHPSRNRDENQLSIPSVHSPPTLKKIEKRGRCKLRVHSTCEWRSFSDRQQGGQHVGVYYSLYNRLQLGP